MDIVEFVKTFPIRTFAKGETLLQVDQETENILIIREGIVKATAINDAGTEQLLWLAGRYDIVPTEGLFNRITTTNYFYTGFCDGSAFVVNKKDFLDKASKDAETMSQIARGMSEHHDDLLNRLNSVEQPTLRSKILFMLQALCEKFSGTDVVQLHEIGLNLTHQDIADMVQATREAVSLELKQLQDEGFITYSRLTFTVNYKKITDQIKTPA